MRLSGFVVGAVVTATSLSSRAADEVPIQWELDGPTTCRDADALGEEILGRTRRARRADENEPARVFHVLIEQHAGHWSGVLDVRDGEKTSSRRVEGGSCEEVRDALAFIAALSLDPTATLTPRARPQPEPEPEPQPGATPNTDTALSSAAERDREPAPAEPEPERFNNEASAFDVRVGAVGLLAHGLGQRAAGGLGVFVWLEEPGVRHWAVDVRVGLRGLVGDELRVPEGQARLDVLSAHLASCPLRIFASSAARVPLCVEADVGGIVASGRGVDDPQTEWRPWVVPAASLRLQAFPWSDLGVEASFGLGFPVTRHRYRFDPDLLIGRVGVAHLRGGIAASWTVW